MGKSRILIIDDDIVLQDLLALFLKVEGFDVVKASDGHTGLQRLHDEPIDLILLDLMMPVMDGVSFMRALRDFQSPPPVLVLSAAGFGQLERDLLAVGARAVVRKPVKPADLIAHVRGVMTGPD